MLPQAGPNSLTQYGGRMVCPRCESRGRAGRCCDCQTVAADSVLAREWHLNNPTPADQVARSSHKRFKWVCPKGHRSYWARCDSR